MISPISDFSNSNFREYSLACGEKDHAISSTSPWDPQNIKKRIKNDDNILVTMDNISKIEKEIDEQLAKVLERTNSLSNCIKNCTAFSKESIEKDQKTQKLHVQVIPPQRDAENITGINPETNMNSNISISNGNSSKESKTEATNTLNSLNEATNQKIVGSKQIREDLKLFVQTNLNNGHLKNLKGTHKSTPRPDFSQPNPFQEALSFSKAISDDVSFSYNRQFSEEHSIPNSSGTYINSDTAKLHSEEISTSKLHFYSKDNQIKDKHQISNNRIMDRMREKVSSFAKEDSISKTNQDLFWFGNEESNHVEYVMQFYTENLIEKRCSFSREPKYFIGKVKRNILHEKNCLKSLDEIEVYQGCSFAPGKAFDKSQIIFGITEWSDDGFPISIERLFCLSDFPRVVEDKSHVSFLYSLPNILKGNFTFISSHNDFPMTYNGGYYQMICGITNLQDLIQSESERCTVSLKEVTKRPVKQLKRPSHFSNCRLISDRHAECQCDSELQDLDNSEDRIQQLFQTIICEEVISCGEGESNSNDSEYASLMASLMNSPTVHFPDSLMDDDFYRSDTDSGSDPESDDDSDSSCSSSCDEN